jgi:hypothetical protein
MFDALARLADGNARRVAIVAAIFFVAAGAIGGSVPMTPRPRACGPTSCWSGRETARQGWWC